MARYSIAIIQITGDEIIFQAIIETFTNKIMVIHYNMKNDIVFLDNIHNKLLKPVTVLKDADFIVHEKLYRCQLEYNYEDKIYLNLLSQWMV